MTESKHSFFSNDASKKFWKIDKKSIKNAIFEFYRQLDYKPNNEEHSITLQKLEVAVQSIIWCIQIISLLWLPDMPITNWSKNMIIWETIGYLKFDNACSELGIMSECLILSLLFICISFLSIIIFIAAIYKTYRIPAYVLSIFRSFFSLWVIFFFIPSIQILAIFLKYNFLELDKVSEYQNNSDSSNFKISLPYIIGIIFSMIFAMILILLYTQFSAEIRHSIYKASIKAKAHSQIDTYIAIFTYFLPICYIVFAQKNIIYIQVFVIIFSATLIKENITLHPYFSFFCNCALILRLSLIAFISFIFILGRLMDNSLAISLIAIILGPLLSIFIIQLALKLERKINKNIPSSIKNINSEYELERSLRYALCSNDFENKDKIIEIFENFFIEKRQICTKIQAVWEANYCLFALEDGSLAKVKLTKNKQISKINFEADFQEYLCDKNISNYPMSETLNFYKFFVEFQLIKRKDKKLCVNLLDFLNEITSYEPKLTYLKEKNKKIDKKISILDQKYSQLSTKYINSKEALSFYASYSRDICCDSEKSALIELKIKSIDKALSNSINDAYNFGCFNDKNGILIISNEAENFGEILYANNKSSEIFRLPLQNIVTDNFFNFFHPYYKERITDEAKQFLKFSSCLEIDLTQGFFLNFPKKLVECVGKISVVSINSLVISILIFREKEIKSKIAILSDDLEIICHSADFQQFSGKIDGSLIGLGIRTLFFNSEGFVLEPFVSYRLPLFFDNTFLVLSYYEFYRIKLPYVVITKGNEENLKLNNKIEFNPNSREHLMIECSLLSVKSSELLTNYKNISLLQDESQVEEDLDSKMNLYEFNNGDYENNNFTDKNDDNKSQLSASSIQNKFLYMVKVSSKSINILHVAFIFTNLIVLAVNIAVLAYSFSTVDIISDVELPLYIGRTGKYFQHLALLPQMILWAYFSQLMEAIMLVPEINTKYIGSLADFEMVYSNVTLNLKKWNYCSGQSIISDENIGLWHTDNGIYTKKENLISAIAQFIKYGNDFEIRLNDSSLGSPWDPFRFLLLNGFGPALDYSYNSLNDVIDCQKSKMSNFKAQMALLLSSGPIVLAVCILLVSPFFYSHFTIENELWCNVRKNASNNYFELKQRFLDRLRDVHCEENILFPNQRPSKRHCTFKSYWRYIWRTMAYFAFVSFFCLINIFYLYDKCAEYLSNRPEVIRNLVQAQILYSNLGIWAIESAADMWGFPLCFQFPSACPFYRASTKIEEILLEIRSTSLSLRNPKYSDILSQKFKNLLYEKNQDVTKDFFAFGTYSAQNYLLLEMYNPAFTVAAPLDILTFTWNSLYIADFYDDVLSEVDKFSKDMIGNQMSIITFSLSGFIFSSFVAYIGFYLPFFKHEKRYLRKINSILKIIPNN